MLARLLVVIAVAGCAEFEIKRAPRLSTKSVAPEPEPGLGKAVKRVVHGQDVIVSRSGTWLVARRCIWARTELHACEVVFVEEGRVKGHVQVFDSRARGSLDDQAKRVVRSVRTAIEQTVGRDRVALSSSLRYGRRDSHSQTYVRIVDDHLELFDWQFRTLPALARAAWHFGDATQTAQLQSPRAPDLLVYELRLRPDAASCYAVFRVDAAGRHHLLALVPPPPRTPDLPRFPTEQEVTLLYARVGRELDEVRGVHTT